MLAIGAQTGSVYPYNVGRDGLVYAKSGSPMQGSQPLTQIDWSTDGDYLQSVTVHHELILCERRSRGGSQGVGRERGRHRAEGGSVSGNRVVGREGGTGKREGAPG